MTDQDSMKRHLLGRASPEERVDFENTYLADPGMFEELVEAENDLIDAYARGQLSETERQEFERRYLSSEKRRARVQYAAALAELSREGQSALPFERSGFFERWGLPFRQHRVSLQWALSLGVVAIVLAVGWVKVSHDRAMLARVTKPSVRPAEQALPQSGKGAQSGGNALGEDLAQNAAPPLEEFTVRLIPGVVRSTGAESKAFPPPKTPWVRLRLALDSDDHGPFTVSVETAEGRLVQRVEGLTSRTLSRKQVVDVRISSHLIPSGDYIVRLSEKTEDGSNEELDSYTFRVSAK